MASVRCAVLLTMAVFGGMTVAEQTEYSSSDLADVSDLIQKPLKVSTEITPEQITPEQMHEIFEHVSKGMQNKSLLQRGEANFSINIDDVDFEELLGGCSLPSINEHNWWKIGSKIESTVKACIKEATKEFADWLAKEFGEKPPFPFNMINTIPQPTRSIIFKEVANAFVTLDGLSMEGIVNWIITLLEGGVDPSAPIDIKPSLSLEQSISNDTLKQQATMDITSFLKIGACDPPDDLACLLRETNILLDNIPDKTTRDFLGILRKDIINPLINDVKCLDPDSDDESFSVKAFHLFSWRDVGCETFLSCSETEAENSFVDLCSCYDDSSSSACMAPVNCFMGMCMPRYPLPSSDEVEKKRKCGAASDKLWKHCPKTCCKNRKESHITKIAKFMKRQIDSQVKAMTDTINKLVSFVLAELDSIPASQILQPFAMSIKTDKFLINKMQEPTPAPPKWTVIRADAACERNDEGIQRFFGNSGFGTREDCMSRCLKTDGCKAIDYYSKGSGYCNMYTAACSTPKATHNGASSYKWQMSLLDVASKDEMSLVDGKEEWFKVVMDFLWDWVFDNFDKDIVDAFTHGEGCYGEVKHMLHRFEKGNGAMFCKQDRTEFCANTKNNLGKLVARKIQNMMKCGMDSAIDKGVEWVMKKIGVAAGLAEDTVEKPLEGAFGAIPEVGAAAFALIWFPIDIAQRGLKPAFQYTAKYILQERIKRDIKMLKEGIFRQLEDIDNWEWLSDAAVVPFPWCKTIDTCECKLNGSCFGLKGFFEFTFLMAVNGLAELVLNPKDIQAKLQKCDEETLNPLYKTLSKNKYECANKMKDEWPKEMVCATYSAE